jgi:hypothetical protein
VRGLVVGIRDDVAVLLSQLGVDLRHDAVRRLRVPDIVRHVVRQPAERERILVDALGALEHAGDEVARADVVEQVG